MLRTGRLLREDFLQQSAFDDDAYCDPSKQLAMLRVIRSADAAMGKAVAGGASAEQAGAAPSIAALARMREWPTADADDGAESLIERVERELEELG